MAVFYFKFSVTWRINLKIKVVIPKKIIAFTNFLGYKIVVIGNNKIESKNLKDLLMKYLIIKNILTLMYENQDLIMDIKLIFVKVLPKEISRQSSDTRKAKIGCILCTTVQKSKPNPYKSSSLINLY